MRWTMGFLLVLSSLVSAAPTKETRPETRFTLIAQSPSFNTKRSIKVADLKGRLTVLTFWTYSRLDSVQAILWAQSMQKKTGSEIVWIGAHSGKYETEHAPENIRDAIVRLGVTLPIVEDGDLTLWQNFVIPSYPSAALILPDGTVSRIFSGDGIYTDLEKELAFFREKLKGELKKNTIPISLESEKPHREFLRYPTKLTYEPNFEGEPAIFVADTGNHRILGFRPSGKIIFTLGRAAAGRKDGDFSTAQFHGPRGFFLKDRSLYIADTLNQLIRRADLTTQKVETVMGTGESGRVKTLQDSPALQTPLAFPLDVAPLTGKQELVIAMGAVNQLWSYSPTSRVLNVVAGGSVVGNEDALAARSVLAQPSALTFVDQTLFFLDSESSTLRQLEKGMVTTLIGGGAKRYGCENGPKGESLMQHPTGLSATKNGIYIADTFNHRIRFYDFAKKELSHAAGQGKRGNRNAPVFYSNFNEPRGVVAHGDLLFVADTNNHEIKVVDVKKDKVTTLKLFSPKDSRQARSYVHP